MTYPRPGSIPNRFHQRLNGLEFNASDFYGCLGKGRSGEFPMGGWEADWGGEAGKSVGRLEVGKLQGREWLG